MNIEQETIYIEIASAEQGKCCDLYPPGSIHRVIESPHGWKNLDRRACYVDPKFKTRIFYYKPKIKTCPVCRMEYREGTPFIDTQQVIGRVMCITCYERKYVVGRVGDYSYREALRNQIKQEYKINP